jgi:hypothetical protein
MRDAVAGWARHVLVEHGTLFASLVKWTLLASDRRVDHGH